MHITHMITQANTTNVTGCEARVHSSHADRSRDHYSPCSLYLGLGVNRLGVGAIFTHVSKRVSKHTRSCFQTRIHLTPDWTTLTVTDVCKGTHLCSAMVYLHFQFPVSWHIKWILKPFLIDPTTNHIFESSGIKAGHIKVLHHIDGNSQ